MSRIGTDQLRDTVFDGAHSANRTPIAGQVLWRLSGLVNR